MKVRHDHVTVFVVRPVGTTREFLQLRRSANDYLGGTWQTVRGTTEAGESAVQTVLRELREETGLTPLQLYSIGIVETFYIIAGDTIYHSPAFLACVAGDASVTLDEEHDAFRWINESELDRAFMWPSERPLIAAIRSDLLDDAACKPHLRVKL